PKRNNVFAGGSFSAGTIFDDISASARGATNFGFRARQANTAIANPAHALRWNANHQGVVGNIARDHCAGSNEAVPAQGRAANDGGIGPDRRALLHQCLAILILARDMTARIDDVREDHRRTAKDVIFQFHTCVYGDVVLNLYIVADDHPLAYDNVLAEAAVF